MAMAHTISDKFEAAHRRGDMRAKLPPAETRSFGMDRHRQLVRRDHLRALAQRIEVADREVRIIGSKNDLLRTLAAISR
jgi:hypothetical protein